MTNQEAIKILEHTRYQVGLPNCQGNKWAANAETIAYNGYQYLVIYGKHINGGFFYIPNWNVGGELSDYNNDVFWNIESITRSLKNKKAARAIAEVIAETI